MCINFNYYLLFILHAFTCTVSYFKFIFNGLAKKIKNSLYRLRNSFITNSQLLESSN